MARRHFDRLTIDGISPPMRRRPRRGWSLSETALSMLLIGVVCASLWLVTGVLLMTRWGVL